MRAEQMIHAAPVDTCFLQRHALGHWTGIFVLWLLLGFYSLALQGQNISNLHTCRIDPRIPVHTLDSFTVAWPLVSILAVDTNNKIPSAYFRLSGNRLYIDTAALFLVYPDCQMLEIQYRTLPLNLSVAISRLDTSAIRKSFRTDLIDFDYSPYKPEKSPWESPGLQSNGNYTRGLSFGNSQNLVFSSNLNLQLNGKLGNDLEILAALSDNSIPLQPDGTTRQLQEFDRVFIQIKKQQTTLTAGDFDLTRPSGAYFSHYFKRLQGGMLETSTQLLKYKNKPLDTLHIKAAAAVSKGKFARQLIQGQEGNQGPYRLQGAEGERFIIVLAGTEKVFADGQQLRRGLNDDYIIDYNTGEVTFSARRLITKDIRIIVEFEYAVQRFLRTTTALQSDWSMGKSKLKFSFYAEQDSKNASGADALSTEERRQLALAGDQLKNAFASGIDTLETFDPTRVSYKIVDTFACGITKPVLIFSTQPDSARYTARFTEVPQGQGNYVQAQSAANGRVFKWVAPDPLSCQPSGNFEPIITLLAPESRQLYTLGIETHPVKGGKLLAEGALSNRDYNRLSPLGQQDNLGAAGVLSYQQQIGKVAATGGWRGKFLAHLEQTSQYFAPLNPYRPAEFSRDWNTGNSQDTVAERLIKSGLSLQHSRWGIVSYEFGYFNRHTIYEGNRHAGRYQWQGFGFNLQTEINLLQTNGNIENTRFSRPKIEFAKTFFKQQKPQFTIGFYSERERNERYDTQTDTLNLQSFQYDLYRFYIKTPENPGALFWNAGWQQRNDFAPKNKDLLSNTTATEAFLSGGWSKTQPMSRQQLNGSLNYRKLNIINPELTPLEAQETYLGRIDYNWSAWKNAVTFTSGYEIGSGQSPKTEFSYLPVNPGEGQYSWIDRNRDSILQVDEMEIAIFQDQANYIRLAVATTEYIRTNNVLFNQDIRLDPRILWGQSRQKWKRLLKRFSTQSTIRISRRTIANASDIQVWNPFQLNIPDTALITQNTSSRNALYLNRANPVWDVSVARNNQSSQSTLTTGFENRRNAGWEMQSRVNFGPQWSLEADWLSGQKSVENQVFISRDYELNTWEVGPSLNWLPLRSFRMSATFKIKNGLNKIGEQENARQTQWQMEIGWNPKSRQTLSTKATATAIRLKASFNDIQYNGQPNTAVSFAMLEGLQNGRNFLWNISIDRQLSKSMQLNLSYEGRKTGSNRLIHVGRAQVTAVF